MVTSVLHNDLKLATIIEQPDTEGPNPLVILLHGNTGWKEEEHLDSLAELLVDEGYIVVRFDAPGSGESAGTWADDYRATTYIESVKTVYEWCVTNLDLDTNKVGIWGHSMGGMVAVQVVARWPELFHALCGCQPSTGKAPQTNSWREDGGYMMKTQIFGDVWLPADFFEDRLQYNTAETVKNLRIPQLFIAGTIDSLVPQSAVEEIFLTANEPKQLEVFETDHFYKEDQAMLKKVNAVTVSFFNKYLNE